MNAFLDILINQILREAAIVMGIIVLLGNIALRKSAKDTLVSTTKAVIGMLILSVGSSTITGASSALMSAIFKRFGVVGVVIDHWTMIGEIGEKIPGSEWGYVGIIMVCAMLVNVVLARFTPIKTIYLTGHIAYSDTCIILFMVYITLGLTGMSLILTTMLLLVLYWWLGTWLFLPITKKLCGKDTPITLGHDMLFGTVIAQFLAGFFKIDDEKNPSCETLKLPGWLNIFSDATMGYSLVMGIMYFFIALVCGPEIVGELAGSKNYLVFGLMQGLQVAVGMSILLMGVRMFLAELLPSFKGFAERIVPGAIAAIDNPAFWSYAPTATLVGFISTSVGMFIGTFLMIAFGLPIVAFPSIIPMFFGGATMGVFCNAKGGWKGTVFGTFILGLIAPFAAGWLASIAGVSVGVGGHSDFGLLWAPIFQVFKLIGGGV